MMDQQGIWYSFGRFCWRCFHGLEWTYDHLSPNKVLIGVAAVCFLWWIKWQNDFNKKAIKEGGLK